jgi:hypothetical protein
MNETSKQWWQDTKQSTKQDSEQRRNYNSIRQEQTKVKMDKVQCQMTKA